LINSVKLYYDHHGNALSIPNKISFSNLKDAFSRYVSLIFSLSTTMDSIVMHTVISTTPPSISHSRWMLTNSARTFLIEWRSYCPRIITWSNNFSKVYSKPLSPAKNATIVLHDARSLFQSNWAFKDWICHELYNNSPSRRYWKVIMPTIVMNAIEKYEQLKASKSNNSPTYLSSYWRDSSMIENRAFVRSLTINSNSPLKNSQ
jgi:hypothetical protein